MKINKIRLRKLLDMYTMLKYHEIYVVFLLTYIFDHFRLIKEIKLSID